MYRSMAQINLTHCILLEQNITPRLESLNNANQHSKLRWPSLQICLQFGVSTNDISAQTSANGSTFPKPVIYNVLLSKNIGLNVCLAEAQNIFPAVTKTSSVCDIISECTCTRQLPVNITYPRLLLFTKKSKHEREWVKISYCNLNQQMHKTVFRDTTIL